jgi:large conductance mechanosensitive channel
MIVRIATVLSGLYQNPKPIKAMIKGMPKIRVRRSPIISRFPWGSFITAIINFMIITWAVFLLIKAVNKIEDFVEGEKDDEKPIKPKPPTVEQLLTEIRDEIRK